MSINLFVFVDGSTVHMLEALSDGVLRCHLDLPGLGEPGAKADDGDLDAVIEGDGAIDVHGEIGEF